jgi:ribosome biogenesis GTPase A
MTKKNKSGIEYLEQNHINWFPGHMKKAIEKIQQNIKLVNIIIEVRDARAPMASGNKENYESRGQKPYLIVLNKTNLADPEAVESWKNWFTKQNESFLFINALDKSSIKSIVKRAKEILQAHRLKSNSTTPLKEKMKMMILGLPNTGKSTIINKLANREASKAASRPGQTKVPLWVKVDKGLDILDTPGVMPPRIDVQAHAMWLSAIHAIPDHIVTPDYSACFIVELLLNLKSPEFKEHYKFESLDIDLVTACDHIGKLRGCLRSGGHYDYEHIYKIILGDFRKGTFGPICFERPPLK